MKTVKIEVDDLIYEFYQEVGKQAGFSVERVMSDALFRMAGKLSLDTIREKEGQRPPLP